MAKNTPRAQSYKANIDRALHNLYTEKRTTLHPMTAIPIFYRRMMRGDVFDFGIVESLLQSEPTFAPLMANWRLEFQWYFDSDANRYGWIDNNTRLTAEEVMTRKHHRAFTTKVVFPSMDDDQNASFVFDPSVDGVGRHSVADYSGVAPGTALFNFDNLDYYDLASSPEDVTFGHWRNIDFHLTYLNIIRNYHINTQFPSIPFVSNVGDGVYAFSSYRLDDLDNLFMFLRSCPQGVSFMPKFGYDELAVDAPTDLVNYYHQSILAFFHYLNSCENYYGGIFCTQYEPDLYQNLLAKDQNLLQSVVTIQDVAGQSGITIEQFRLKNHLQGLYDKIFVSGGTDRDLSRTIWGIESNKQYDIPELLCVHSEIIGTNLIESTTAGESRGASSETYSNVPGSLAGNINTRRGKGRIQKFKANTSGSLMCLVTLTPIVDYCQNIERHLLEGDFMDEFTPDMARKGFENIPLSDYCSLIRTNRNDVDGDEFFASPLNNVVGKQIAWMREMTSVNRVHGEFSNYGEKRDWVLVRRYLTTDSGGLDTLNISPYGNPLHWQYPFVSQTINDPNFYLQVGIHCKAYRPVPRRFMPNLGY